MDCRWIGFWIAPIIEPLLRSVRCLLRHNRQDNYLCVPDNVYPSLSTYAAKYSGSVSGGGDW